MKPLTPGEREVYPLLKAGISRYEVARKLQKTAQAVRSIRRRIVQKGYKLPRGKPGNPAWMAKTGVKSPAKWHCEDCHKPVTYRSKRCKSCAGKKNSLPSRWRCVLDPEKVYIGRTVRDFGETLRAGYWPAGSVWIPEGGDVAYRVVECQGQFLEQVPAGDL